MVTVSILTSSSLIDVVAGQECKHVASALDTSWPQTHGHKLLTVDTDTYHLFEVMLKSLFKMQFRNKNYSQQKTSIYTYQIY